MNDNFKAKAAQWDSPDKIIMTKKFLSEMLFNVNPLPSWKALEIGAGTGLVGLNVEPLVAKVVMVDTSESMLEVLKQKLDKINSAEPDVLRNMYMKQMEVSLENGSRTNAGLGLLEIARAVNGPIKYKFVPLESGYTFFCVELFLSLN